MECFICKSKVNIVTGFPRNKPALEIWKKNLNINEAGTLQGKKLCIQHFHPSFHKTLLDVNSVRGRYIFPLSNNENQTVESPVVAVKRPLESDSAPNKKHVNYDLIIEMKDDEISELKKKVKELQKQNQLLEKQLKVTKSVPFIVKQALEITKNLNEPSKVLVNMLLTAKKGHIYTEEEKMFCQSFYYKYPGAFTFLKDLLGFGLPSRKTLIRWQTFKQFNVGIIKEVMLHLKEISSQFTDEEKKMTLILDEMDGKPGLRYCKGRDTLVGYEHLLEKSDKLAKKFLAMMIRGMNPKLGNFVFATFATEKGINGNYNFSYKYSLFF